MRITILCTLALLITTTLAAQHNLSGSHQFSTCTYIYKITPQEAEKLNTTRLEKVEQSFLHTLADSFKTNTQPPVLKEGNYLLVSAQQNKLVFRLHTPSNAEIKLVNNDRDIFVAVHTKQGTMIAGAIVRSDGKKLKYNNTVQAYGPITKKRGRTLITVYQNNTFYSFPANIRPIKKPALLAKLFMPFRFKYNARQTRYQYRYRNNYASGYTAYERKFNGFMVFNKPMYKPGDTVKLKAFVQNKNGKPAERPLLLRIFDRYLDTDTIIATISPYRPGGYDYAFVLSDSLDLDLDEDYTATLEELSSGKYDLNNYDGDMDDDEYAAQRKVLIRGKFRHEDYELQSVTFTARSNKKIHNRGEEIALFLKAVDENELAVMDGRAEIIVLSNGDNYSSFFERKVFLPDTLWKYSQPLESVGETKIVVPDSIFPPASLNYIVQCVFRNSNNERQDESLSQEFIHQKEAIFFATKEDSLQIQYLVSGTSTPAHAMLYALKKSDTLERSSIQLPAAIKLNPFVTSYAVKTGDVYQRYDVTFEKGMVSCVALRTKDSVMVQLVNPQHLPVWYTIFAGNKIAERGFADSLWFAQKSVTEKNYFVSLQYIYRNNIYREDYTIPYQDKLLNVRVDQPETIYPGQPVNVGIYVTDALGKPVAGADVTAYAFTKKFDAQNPYIPYLGKFYPLRKPGRKMTMEIMDDYQRSVKLNWQRWSREMNLDTSEYYKFLHPDNVYINREAVEDSITQIAPFVTIKGDLQPVQMLYIDEAPVFFSQANHLKRYSFRVSPGMHSLRIRTSNHSIKIDSVFAQKGVKTFISIEADTLNKKIVIEKMPDTLTAWEKQLWGRYVILIEKNFGENYAYVQQNQHYFLLNHAYTVGQALVGPLYELNATLTVKNKFEQDFYPEGSWQFNIAQGLIKQRQLLKLQLFGTRLPDAPPVFNFKDLVLTAKEIDSLWQNYLDNRSSSIELFKNDWQFKTGSGRLRIGLPELAATNIKNIIIFRYDNAYFMKIFPGATRDLGFLRPGNYRVMLLFRQNNYVVADSIHIKQDGINYYEIEIDNLKKQDTVSKKIASIIESRVAGQPNYAGRDLDAIKEAFNSTYLDGSAFTEIITGTVTDTKGNFVPAASIIIKGTRIGVTTNSLGQFTLRTPPDGYITVNAVGYVEQQLKIVGGAHYNVMLSVSEYNLSEVVVTGYSKVASKSLAGSVTGVNMVGGIGGTVPGMVLRGKSSGLGQQPLLIVDGLPYSGKLEDIPKEQVNNVSVLQPDAATALYGSIAAAGAIIITTKKTAGAQADELQPQTGNALRRNFHDDAYWQPRLRTNADGYANFTVAYPDDITNWRTFTIAWAGKNRTGSTFGTVKSFKALSGNIALPLFAVEGDSINVIGKALNYLPGEVSVKRTFAINDKPVSENIISFRHSRIDTFSVSAAAGDSLKLAYTIQKEDGYFDGEERSIPVLKPGVLETNGFFAALTGDTSFTLRMKKDSGTIKLYAEASLLPVFYTETESIRNYEYLCNEQLASKLKAMLVQKRIDEYYQRPFKGEKNIQDLIKKLNSSKSAGNLWGWWTGTQPTIWISLHVTEALLDAERSGYTIALNKTAIIDYLIFSMENYRNDEKLSALYMLHKLGAKADYKRYVDSVEKLQRKRSTFYERLKLIEFKQLVNMPVQIDSLIPKYNRTAFGNIYWGEENYFFFENSIQITLAMYRILRNDGQHKDLNQKIRNYFLEKRKSGNWRNTYESSLILETILPDLLAETQSPGPATFAVNGTTIQHFPYAVELRTDEDISISKSGGLPVYFTAYQQHWNAQPQKLNGNFRVTTAFEQNGHSATTLTAGIPARLTASITVVADADYVMIEIPIPAGCSYNNKAQYYFNNEVHREYFKNKVSIFCEKLPKGRYEYEVLLLPRYTGKYILNPAKAEMMYFPVFNGREAIRNVEIK